MTTDGQPRPFVSVIVPVYNDPAGIRQTLRTLAAQTYPEDRYEVLVVDEGSTDRTPSVAWGFSATMSNLHVLVEEEVQSSYAARNAGIDHASGSVLAFLSADVTVERDWLETAVEEMEANDSDYLACGIEVYPSGEETLAAKYDRLQDVCIDRPPEPLEFVHTCALLVRRSTVEELGSFDERITSSGDWEFGNRVAASGRRRDVTDRATVLRPACNSVGAILRETVLTGRDKHRLRTLYPERYGRPLLGLAHPKRYVPPLPRTVAQRLDEWSSLPAWEKAAFWGLSYLKRLSIAYGELREAVTYTRTGSEHVRDVAGFDD